MTATLVLAGLALLAFAALAFRWTDRVTTLSPVDVSRRSMFVAYAGGAAGVCGTAAVTMAVVMATVHRLVPSRPRRPGGMP